MTSRSPSPQPRRSTKRTRFSRDSSHDRSYESARHRDSKDARSVFMGRRGE